MTGKLLQHSLKGVTIKKSHAKMDLEQQQKKKNLVLLSFKPFFMAGLLSSHNFCSASLTAAGANSLAPGSSKTPHANFVLSLFFEHERKRKLSFSRNKEAPPRKSLSYSANIPGWGPQKSRAQLPPLPSQPKKRKNNIPIFQPISNRKTYLTIPYTPRAGTMGPKLEHAFTMRGYMNKENSLDLKTIKFGPQRIIVPITHGFIEGSGLKAEIVPGGGDWILVLSLPLYSLLTDLLTASLPIARPRNKGFPPRRPHAGPHLRRRIHLRALQQRPQSRRGH
jgi:hypothetical protein